MVVATGILILLTGLATTVGGVWLLALGGSLYYALAGIALLVTAALLFMRRAEALWVYAALLAVTLIWALVEVGFDWWQLAPRGGVLVILGVLLVTPWVRRDLCWRRSAPPRWVGGTATLAATLAATLIVAAVAMLFVSPHDTDSDAQIAFAGSSNARPPEGGDWPAYRGTNAGLAHSPLTQITPDNVDDLEVAWSFNTGDQPGGGATYEVTPLKVGNKLYICTPSQLVIALDATTGEEIWRYDPNVSEEALTINSTCRGVTYDDGTAGDDEPALGGGACATRVFMPTSDARLIALDAATGAICTGFADNGVIDLMAHMPNSETNLYYVNSPPVIAAGLILLGGSVSDNVSVNEPSGVIRAYDLETGELVWNFDTGNPEQTEPLADGETYTENSPNAWAPLSADEELGLLYAPLGNAPPDQYGANRSPETERFSSSVIALDLETGELEWVFQTVHHDIWDMDVPAQPVLVDLDFDGESVPALVQPTKQGDIYVLDRRTGEPILPVTEVPAPQGAIGEDYTEPTQPVSDLTYMPDPVEEKDMWGVTMFDQLMCRIRYRELDYEGRYTPPSTNGMLQHPGNFGVFNWGGVAVDPERHIVFTTPSYLAFTIRLVPRPDDTTPILTDEPPYNNENFGAPYAVDIQTFLSPIGLPCQAPPWGYVSAADLTTGEILWMHPNGTVRDLAPVPLPFGMGVPDLGGPMTTASGLAFMSGTLDYFVRAFDVETGEELWADRLPAGGHATPMSYADENGRQIVIIVAGGHGGLGTTQGDSIIAYALPGGVSGE